MRKAAALVRVSTEIQTLESQVQDLCRVAQTHGFEIPEEFVFQEKISGYDEDYYKDRRSIRELKSFIQTDHPEAIFIWELSRLSRRAVKISKYINELSINPRIPMYFNDLQLWTIDPGTGNILDNNILEINASAKGCELEREKIKARTKRGKDLLAEKGLYIGVLSDGYIANDEKEIIIDENRIDVQKTIFQLALKGVNCVEIAKVLNEKKIPTFFQYRTQHSFWKFRKDTIGPTSWTKASVIETLKNKWYAGVRTYNDKSYSIPSIISLEDWEMLQIRLKENAIPNSNETATKHFYLLNGLIKCGICGEPLYGHYTGLNNHYYCKSMDGTHCGLRGINQDNLDAIVFKIIKLFFLESDLYQSVLTNGGTGYLANILSSMSIQKDLLIKEKSEFETRLNNKQNDLIDLSKKLKKITKLLIDTDEDSTSYNTYKTLQEEKEKEIKKVDGEIETLKKKIVDKEKEINKAEEIYNLPTIYCNLSTEDFRAIMRPLIDRITVYNADSNTSVIKLMLNKIVPEEIRSFTILYSPRLLRENFILLCPWFITSVLISPNVSPLFFVFQKYTLDFSSKEETPLSYDIKNGNIRIAEGIHLLSNDNGLFLAKDADLHLIKEDLNGCGYDKGFEDLTGEISMRKFVDICRQKREIVTNKKSLFSEQTQKHLSSKTGSVKTIILSYERLFKPSEKALKQLEKLKEWEKNNNKGGKTIEPYIIKDELYKEIVQMRKHLYNRKYKIKKNKSLSEKEKKGKMEEISKELKDLQKKINYIEGSFAKKKFKD